MCIMRDVISTWHQVFNFDCCCQSKVNNMIMARLLLLVTLLVSSTHGLQRTSVAPWCIPRGGASESRYSTELEVVKSAAIDKAMTSVSFGCNMLGCVTRASYSANGDQLIDRRIAKIGS
jgi:hypothetical protein